MIKTAAARNSRYFRGYMHRAILGYKEALKIENIRNEFFVQLKELLQKQQN
jgi:hypothetical protein